MILHVYPARPEHEALVVDNWIKSYRRAAEVRNVPRDLYAHGMRARIWHLRDTGTTLIAESSGVFLGWVVFDKDGVHYAYVKHDYRRQGVATRLVEGIEPKVFTHRVSGAWNEALKRHGWVHAPEKGRPCGRSTSG